MATAEKKAARQDVVLVWEGYLESTRGLDAEHYEQVEPHAWKILKDKLRKLGVKVHGEA